MNINKPEDNSGGDNEDQCKEFTTTAEPMEGIIDKPGAPTEESAEEIAPNPLDERMLQMLEQQTVFMLEYEEKMFVDVVHSDCLTICAKGVSYDLVVTNLLKVYGDPKDLVLVINSSEQEEKLYRSRLNPDIITEIANTGPEREKNYLKGGIQFITTRILVVDLLKKRIPIEAITGIFVLRAHSVLESCQEAFALRLYRQSNKTGFVKAFSGYAEFFTFGFGHVERVMRNLFVTELYIWPRFHADIQKSLRPFEPQVIELQIPMSPKMSLIQTQILDLMNYIVKEIKRINRTLDMQEITVENTVTSQFLNILQSQLEAVWNQLSSQTKTLVADLKILRGLMFSTIYNDSVTLYSSMKRYRTTEYARSNSGWTLLAPAEKMFNLCKERVFNKNDEFNPELPPKWKALSEILKVEIPTDLRKYSSSDGSNVKVLILCYDARTCYQLRQYLTLGGKKYLLHTALKTDTVISKLSEEYKNIDVDPIEKDKASATKKTKKDTKNKNDITAVDQVPEEESNLFAEDANGEESDYCLKDSYMLTMTQRMDDSVNALAADFDLTAMENTQFENFPELDNLNVTDIIQNYQNPVVFIQSFKSDSFVVSSLEQMLEEIKPNYVIMYNSSVAAIRQIEIYEARQHRELAKRLKVFFLIHSRTVEEQSYLTNLRREKNAFELLIETKSKMVIPENQDGKKVDELLGTDADDLDETAISSRAAGGQTTESRKNIKPRVIVDMREFRSDLPCLIHKRGIEVLPVTIAIGDYILTPEVCVERKSISDLIGSLNSGRLYNQCVQMTRYYSKPMLLIEFDQNKPFHLQGYFMISQDNPTSNMDITQKLILLTVHFPKLKIIWSPSPYATAQLFEEIKHGKDEPDSEAAMACGSDNIDNNDVDQITEKYNVNIHDFIIKLPGINSRNIRKITSEVKCLKDLISMSKDQLTELLEHSVNAKLLWETLHLPQKAAAQNSIDKPAPSKFRRGFGARRK